MTRTRSKGNQLARRRGKAFEKKVASLLDGHLHPGIDGDVWAEDASGVKTMYEAKYRAGLRFTQNDELWHFLDQINRYVTKHWQEGQRWGLILSGGIHAKFPKLSKSGTFVLTSVEEYKESRDKAALWDLYQKRIANGSD